MAKFKSDMLMIVILAEIRMVELGEMGATEVVEAMRADLTEIYRRL